MEEEKSDEDRIIEALVLEGRDGLYEDIDFLPLRQSLYNSENIIPEYDDEIGQHIQWCRPNKIYDQPVYFNPDIKQLSVTLGSLPDQLFLGTLMAICVYSKYDLIENIFASKPDDFINYGIYTCRFYVDGEWVEVLTDTHLPCIKNNLTGKFSPVYGTSFNANELWVTFVEKAFAKAIGSYEEIPNIKVQKALLHLTGGSVQVLSLADQVHQQDQKSDGEAWRVFRHKIDNDDMLIILTATNTMNRNKSEFEGMDDGEMNTYEEAGNISASQSLHSSTGAAATQKHVSKEHHKYFVPDYLYSVVLCREVGGHELVLMHNPWKVEGYKWSGEWSDQSNEWDMFPEVLYEIDKDPTIPWSRYHPNGYFWISFRNLLNFFNKTYYCKLFPNDKYHFYCSHGACKSKQSGGPLQPLRPREVVLKDFSQSKTKAIIKATAAEVIDGDSSWFNNPQYRLICPNPGVNRVYISVSPVGSDESIVEQNQSIQLTLTSSSKQSNLPVNLWDISMFDLIATDHDDSLVERVKGQETSIWRVDVDSKHIYHIIPNTIKRKVESDFILRVFAVKPVIMELVVPVPNYVISGQWKKSGDMDTTGGPLKLLQGDGTYKSNPKWCQNPQYHIEIVDPFGKEEVYLKIVVKRTDSQTEKRTTKYAHHQDADAKKVVDAAVGLLICKADVLDTVKKIKKKPPRQNIMGELLPTKASSLKKKSGHNEITTSLSNENNATNTPKTILRKLTIDNNEYYTESTYCSKLDACIFYPKIPRAWIPNGLIVVPSLNDKNIKGAFDIEVYASERVYVNQLPDSYSKTISGDWLENNAGGNHLNPNTWKKNPKFALKILQPMNTLDPINIRISIARVGTSWKLMSRKDTIGCMIGFYIFISNIHTSELQLHYESTFIPEDELVTDQNFQLPQLNHGQVYMIMPTTYDEGKIGSFVISILCEYEFSIAKDKEK